MSLLEVNGLAKSFGGVHAVRDVSFDVAAGEVVAMIGPNGAGKTTCFNLLSGQAAADAGEVRLNGRSLQGLAARHIWRRGVARTFQITSTFGSMSVKENVLVALASRERRLWSFLRLALREYWAEADALLERVGIAHLSARVCAELAYGDLKRVEVAMVLAGRPRLLLMDEPAAGMAREERGALMALATELARRDGVAVLFTEHDMDVVFTHAQRVLVLHQGELIANAAPALVRADARVRQIYLGGDDA